MTNDDYIALLKQRLGEKRFNHSLNVAEEAVRLAKKYSVDVEKAYKAGLLHDIMKEEKPEIQFEAIVKSGMPFTEVEKSNQKLWHAMAGAAYIKNELGIEDEEIINAVRYHTTAKAGMTMLEKVIYIADFTSKERDYDGVEKMRELADVSLEQAMLEGLSFTLQKLVEKNKLLNLDSINAYNEVAAVCGKGNNI
ncbi:MAG: bis(5'-nucleosyl)-tetraphosphatase (symmetrical) YqeK [Clostridiales bacterium]|nr:bis(5'-nucleosyl)-tetraphosphatase (symmetrical) YqeK [Clostridiales bacterium]